MDRMLRNKFYTPLITGIILSLILFSLLYQYPDVYSGGKNNYILIDENGNVIPSNAPIVKVNSYTFMLTDDVNSTIVIKKKYILLSGAGHKIYDTKIGVEASNIISIKISNVTFENCKLGVEGSGLKKILIEDAYFINCSRGVEIANLHFGSISNSTFINSSDSIVIKSNSSYIWIYGNVIRGYSIGISIFNSRDIGIYGNKIIHGFRGIYLYESEGVDISNNIVSWNYEDGILIESFESMDTLSGISGNILSNNSIGIELAKVSNNTIEANNIWMNSVGIMFVEAYHNRIFLNSFRRNRHDVYDIALDNPGKYNLSKNIWNSVYGRGGNYWDKYNGTDIYSGPSQNTSGSDGIYDKPYNIYDDNIDHYPLTHDINIVKPRKQPSIQIEKDFFIGSPGSKIPFKFDLTNNDPREYGASVYILQIVYPQEWRETSGWIYVVAFSNSTIHVTVSYMEGITIPYEVTPGNYTVILKAYNFINKTLSDIHSLTVRIYNSLSHIEIENVSIRKGYYDISSNITVKARLINLDMREGVIYPVLRLGGFTLRFDGFIMRGKYVSYKPIYVPPKRIVNITLVYHMVTIFPGAYTVSFQIYNASLGSKWSSIIAEYNFGNKYLIEVGGRWEQYIQVSNITLENKTYSLIYLFFPENVVGRSEIHYYDLGSTLEDYGLKHNIEWIYRLGKGLELMDMALGPYNISFDRKNGLRVSILYDGRKGYVIDKSPINITSRDIDPDKYVHGYFLKGIISNNTYIDTGVIGFGNYSFIRITYISSGTSLTVDLNGTMINNTSYSNWPDNFVYYDIGNKSVIVLPIDVDRFCLELNQTNPDIGSTYYSLILESYRNGKKISGAIEEGTIGRDGVRICADVVNGLLRVFKINKPLGFNPWYIFIGLATSMIIAALIYYYMSLSRRK